MPWVPSSASPSHRFFADFQPPGRAEGNGSSRRMGLSHEVWASSANFYRNDDFLDIASGTMIE
jgi:hypothetical protein